MSPPGSASSRRAAPTITAIRRPTPKLTRCCTSQARSPTCCEPGSTMPRLLPGSPGLLFEFGASALVPPRAWFQTPPPRDVDVARLIRTSYASSTGKGLVGLGLVLGVPLLVIGILAMATDPWHIVTAALGGLFAAFLVIVPALPALRFARALRHGV